MARALLYSERRRLGCSRRLDSCVRAPPGPNGYGVLCVCVRPRACGPVVESGEALLALKIQIRFQMSQGGYRARFSAKENILPKLRFLLPLLVSSDELALV